MVKYPVITPIGQQNANSIYNIRLNKRNMARIITVLTTISDESSIASDRNEMRSNIYRNMASVRSNGTFDPMSNDIQLNLVNEDSSPTIVGLTPKSLKILVTDTGANQAMLASTWDRNMISLQASGVVDDDTIFSVQMVTTSHHAQLL